MFGDVAGIVTQMGWFDTKIRLYSERTVRRRRGEDTLSTRSHGGTRLGMLGVDDSPRRRRRGESSNNGTGESCRTRRLHHQESCSN